jgi:hypothetical protein
LPIAALVNARIAILDDYLFHCRLPCGRRPSRCRIGNGCRAHDVRVQDLRKEPRAVEGGARRIERAAPLATADIGSFARAGRRSRMKTPATRRARRCPLLCIAPDGIGSDDNITTIVSIAGAAAAANSTRHRETDRDEEPL